MKAKDKFFSVRYGWIKEGQEIPKAAMQEAAAAGVVSYKTKVTKHERDNQKQLERDAADSASVQASDNESGAESPSAVRGKWFAS
jgi:hypothetical protein